MGDKLPLVSLPGQLGQLTLSRPCYSACRPQHILLQQLPGWEQRQQEYTFIFSRRLQNSQCPLRVPQAVSAQ